MGERGSNWFSGKDVNLNRYVNNVGTNNIDLDGLETCSLMISFSGSWTSNVAPLYSSIGVGTNPGIWYYTPATSIYCYRTRVWHLGYNCPGSWFRCPAITSQTHTEFQALTVAVPSDVIIMQGNLTIPIPTGLPGPGPGLIISGFLTPDDIQHAINICNDNIIVSFPVSTYTPPVTFYR